jgi:hypothetical protein
VKADTVVKVAKRRKKKHSSDDDTDFQVEESEDDENDAEALVEAQVEAQNLKDTDAQRRSASTIVNKSLYKQSSAGASKVPSDMLSKIKSSSVTQDPVVKPSPSNPIDPAMSSLVKPVKYSTTRPVTIDPSPIVDLTSEPPTNHSTVAPFQRARLPIRSPYDPAFGHYDMHACPACHKTHPRGACELKAAGVEHCGLCGLAHYGHARTCPHIKSETQVREMLLALKSSPEKKELVDMAIKYLRGVKGHLVQQKKREKATMQAAGGVPVPDPSRPPLVNQRPGQLLEGHTKQLGHGANAARPIYGPPPQGGGSFPQMYHTSVGPVSGSVGSHLLEQAQRGSAQQQGLGPDLEDHDVENALRGFLGR